MSTVANAFISHTDHLPSDIIRSLWLVQSLNISIDNHYQQLEQLTQDYKKNIISLEDFKHQYLQRCQTLDSLINESIQETRALHNQLLIYDVSINDEISKLNNYESKKDKDTLEFKQLRDKLKIHYNEHPLTSQREALKEQQLNKNKKSLINLPKQPPLKLMKPVDKLPSRKLVKPKSPLSSPKSSRSSPKSSRLSGRSPRLSDKLSKSPVVNSKVRVKVQPSKPTTPKSTKLNAMDQPVSTKVTPAVQYDMIQPEIAVIDDKTEYCFCKQGSFGDMIACDNETSCPNGEWFHYKCVGLNKVEALKYTSGKLKWFCSDHCKNIVLSKPKKKKKRRW